MPEIAVFDAHGTAGQAVSLRDDVFGGPPNNDLLHQAVVRAEANKRQGTHDSQTRAEVSRTTKKVWRQKGTGRARQGSRKGPHWTGGGVAFGPHPRSYRQDMPKSMRAAAVRSALSAKAGAGELVLIEEVKLEAPNTKQINQLLTTVAGKHSTLLLLETPQPMVQLSVRNLQHVTATTVESVNAYDLLRFQRVVMSVGAARVLEERYGRGDAAGASEAAAGTPATAQAEE